MALVSLVPPGRGHARRRRRRRNIQRDVERYCQQFQYAYLESVAPLALKRFAAQQWTRRLLGLRVRDRRGECRRPRGRRRRAGASSRTSGTDPPGDDPDPDPGALPSRYPARDLPAPGLVFGRSLATAARAR